jgi:hypothetical protein
MTEPMPTRYNTTARIPILVHITCERCDHAYTTNQEIVASSSYPLDVQAAQASAQDGLNSQIRRIQLGDCGALDGSPCPNCGYVQSWMLQNRVRSSRQVVSYIASALTLFALLVLGLAGRLGIARPLAVPAALAGGLLAFYAARPVVGWLYLNKRRAASKHASRLPSIELVHTIAR